MKRAQNLRNLRNACAIAAALAVMAPLAACGGEQTDAGDTVSIGAAYPLSGAFAFNGNATLDGARAAAQDINAAGGIESLGGAELQIDRIDVGDTAETATSAVDRYLSSNEDTPVMLGSWTSTLTLPVSAVTERRGVPMVGEAFADEATEREGFSHLFVDTLPASELGAQLVDSVITSMERGGIDVQDAMIVGDNSPAAVPLQEGLVGELESVDVSVEREQPWTSPLRSPGTVAEQVVSADPDVLFLIGYTFSDISGVVRALRARGYDGPIVQNGGQATVPQWRDLGDRVEGVATFVLTSPLDKSQELADRLSTELDEPFITQDQLLGYFGVQIIAAALEEAGSTDREDVTEALAALEVTEGPAVDVVPTDSFSFDESGRITPTFGAIAQWQEVDGELVPCTIEPAEYAVCDPKW